MVGTDGSLGAAKAIAAAAEIALACGATVHLVSVHTRASDARLRGEREAVREFHHGRDFDWVSNPEQRLESILGAAAADISARGIRVETHGSRGAPADAILDVAEENEADLIVVGSKGMTGARRFLLGSVPGKITHHASCDVLIVKTE